MKLNQDSMRWCKMSTGGRCSNVKWFVLGLFFFAIVVQFLMNFSLIQTNIQAMLTNNIYISSNSNVQSDIVQGKFRIKIDNLVITKTTPLTTVPTTTVTKPVIVTSKQLSTTKTVVTSKPKVSVTSQVVSSRPVTSPPTIVTSKKQPYLENGIGLAACPLIPPGLVGPINADTNSNIFWKDLDAKYPDVQPGGRWWPKNCKSRNRIAIIIPYRNREAHLKVLLNNLHPMFQKQQLDYGIFVIDEALPTTFNRAMLFNIGYVEALKRYPYQCFAFHDVDLLPENDKNIYSCPGQPRHMSVAIDKFNYRLPYYALFGGVSALTKEQMVKVNGFSNKFFGWGGEDDDMSDRVRSHGYQISRYPNEIARYKMIKHGTEAGNKVNPARFRLLHESKRRFRTDGISSLKGTYSVQKQEDKKMYTIITVKLDEAAVAKT